ncbi:MAG: ABC transporter ATP-binding protein/permease [Anaerolineae bacterium]|nr:ABC transporter ATP-binding protein/permease [Anaerolineae bacterium]
MNATRKLGGFLRPYWYWAVLAPLMMMVEVAMDLLQPRMVERIIDQGIAQSNMTVVIQTGLIMIGLAAVGLVGGMGCTVFSVLAATGFGADLRGTLFGKVQALSFGNLDKLETGKLITRLTNDVVQVQDMVMMLLRIMVRAPLLMVGSLILGIMTSPQLALLFVVLIPLVSIVLVWTISKTYPMFSEVQRRLDRVNTVLQENLAGVRVIKAFVQERHEINRFHKANDNLMDQNITTARVLALNMPLVMLILNFGVVAALWFGGVQVNAGTLQVGQVIAFINYLTQTLMGLMMVSMLTMRLSRSEASAERIHEVLNNEPEVKSKANALTEFAPQGRVVFEDVSFSYTGADHDPVLKNINLVAEPGQTVALLGATGAGKSSLIHLIPRFYDVSGGRVIIDGIDVRDIDELALRRRIGVALQESVLFSGTIRENIRYGRPDASDEEVIAVAKMAQAHDFIMRFPDGYDSMVGQRGVNLSGGQKQRIAIARALLTQPSVLILDDSTSSVDVETEARIQAAMAAALRGRTGFVVAQRISTVLNADKILVLDDGKIAAEGTHDELMASSSIYREIYESQMENGVNAHA